MVDPGMASRTSGPEPKQPPTVGSCTTLASSAWPTLQACRSGTSPTFSAPSRPTMGDRAATLGTLAAT
eukprot:11136881-Lingulodinium_polyedra.AAC.1